MRSPASALLAIVGLAFAAATGCAPKVRPASPGVSQGMMSCTPLPGEGHPAPIAILLTDSVSFDGAPGPANDSERLVFRQLYETLVSVDCTGELRPGLAESWSSSDSGKVWTFTLRDAAHFWDGTPILAADVKQSWIDAREKSDEAPPHLPWAWLDPRTDSVVALDNRHLQIAGNARLGESPQLFADPLLAVVKPRDDGIGPLGSGPFQPIDLVAIEGGGRWDLTCAAAGLRSGAEHRILEFRIRPGMDPRDLQPGEPDALLVRDRSLVDYLVAAGSVDAVALGWDRLYLLLAPWAAGDSAHSAPNWLSAHDRAELAREVVVADAEPAESFDFADATGACLSLPPRHPVPVPRPAGNRIAYRDDDVDGRRLAERLAALAGMHDGMSPAPQAAGLSPAAFTSSLEKGDDSAYVVRLDRRYASACLETGELLGNAPWLEPGESAVALVRTRPTLVVRRGLIGIGVDYDGAVRLAGAGWAANGASDP